MIGRVLLTVATFALLHAAYSTYEHLSHLKALGRPEGPLPLNIVYESILALILGILGASLNAPPLKEITWASEMKTRSIDGMDSRLGFANYNNRGRMLFAHTPSEKS
ncbi:magnesium transporter [Hygrophoropsis aurantiaca]|uniref:Magnesium transporter n=1 Tax=Hygrophoropsis aurantiaca TaxID=72124 RepID=A0ACB8A2E9_9AGAM|nr:magnesium transporter [Hygrophoropsis aurantiaca]